MTPALKDHTLLSINLNSGCIQMGAYQLQPDLLVTNAFDPKGRVLKDRYCVYHEPTMTVLLPTFGSNPLEIALEMANRLSDMPDLLRNYDGSPAQLDKIKPDLRKIMLAVFNNL